MRGLLEVTGCISRRPQLESSPQTWRPNSSTLQSIANAKSIADANCDIKVLLPVNKNYHVHEVLTTRNNTNRQNTLSKVETRKGIAHSVTPYITKFHQTKGSRPRDLLPKRNFKIQV